METISVMIAGPAQTEVRLAGRSISPGLGMGHPRDESADPHARYQCLHGLTAGAHLWYYLKNHNLKSHCWSNRANCDYNDLEEAAVGAWQAADLQAEMMRFPNQPASSDAPAQ